MSRERGEKPHKLTVVLPAVSHDTLVDLAERRSTTRTNILTRAIADAAFFADQMAQGKEVHIVDPATEQDTRVIWTEDYHLSSSIAGEVNKT